MGVAPERAAFQGGLTNRVGAVAVVVDFNGNDVGATEIAAEGEAARQVGDVVAGSAGAGAAAGPGREGVGVCDEVGAGGCGRCAQHHQLRQTQAGACVASAVCDARIQVVVGASRQYAGVQYQVGNAGLHLCGGQRHLCQNSGVVEQGQCVASHRISSQNDTESHGAGGTGDGVVVAHAAVRAGQQHQAVRGLWHLQVDVDVHRVAGGAEVARRVHGLGTQSVFARTEADVAEHKAAVGVG